MAQAGIKLTNTIIQTGRANRMMNRKLVITRYLNFNSENDSDFDD